MIGGKLTKSVVITGASVTGKTTLCRRLLVHFGVQPVPVHTTRSLRDGEIAAVDSVFMSEEDFKTHFSKGDYLQDTLESTYFSGAYYGCPKEWISSTREDNFTCFVSPTVKMAKKLKENLGDKIFWVHLIANKNIREERLKKRDPNLKKEEFETRVERGGVVVDIDGHDLVIDTSNLNAWEIFFRALVNI